MGNPRRCLLIGRNASLTRFGYLCPSHSAPIMYSFSKVLPVHADFLDRESRAEDARAHLEIRTLFQFHDKKGCEICADIGLPDDAIHRPDVGRTGWGRERRMRVPLPEIIEAFVVVPCPLEKTMNRLFMEFRIPDEMAERPSLFLHCDLRDLKRICLD